jgi:hypothetical protein
VNEPHPPLVTVPTTPWGAVPIQFGYRPQPLLGTVPTPTLGKVSNPKSGTDPPHHWIKSLLPPLVQSTWKCWVQSLPPVCSFAKQVGGNCGQRSVGWGLYPIQWAGVGIVPNGIGVGSVPLAWWVGTLPNGRWCGEIIFRPGDVDCTRRPLGWGLYPPAGGGECTHRLFVCGQRPGVGDCA